MKMKHTMPMVLKKVGGNVANACNILLGSV